MDTLKTQEENSIATTGIIPINIKDEQYKLLISFYTEAMNQTINQLEEIKKAFKIIYGYDVINSISSRIKTPESIINKMKKKNYELNYKNLIENINDVAGIRIVCMQKDNINSVINVIKQMQNVKIVNEKDYIKNPKKSGYSGYHMIIEAMIQVNETEIPIKVEIQIRTMAMDFWSTNEHKLKYKTNKELSKSDSRKLTFYAKVLNLIDDRIMKIYNRQSRMVNM